MYMRKIRKITPMLVLLFFVLPSVSSAAALTQQQSASLIAVVQSSPGTPASAFVSLITAFSNITTAQAASLITVIQAAPGVPANSFVNLLTSFTVDTPTTSVVTPGATTQTQTSIIQISSINITPTVTSAKIEWQTNKLTESKIFLSGSGFSSKVYSSESGISTRHSVFVDGLNSNTDYTYEIEVISNSNFVKKIGGFKTPGRMVTNLIIKLGSSNPLGSNCGGIRILAYTEDQSGVFLPGVPVTFTNPETKETTTAISQISNEPGKVAVADFSYTPQAHAHITKNQTVRISAGSIEKQLTVTLGETSWEEIPPTMKNIMLNNNATWLDTLSGQQINEKNYLGQDVSYSLDKNVWGSVWEFVEMATTTYPAAEHIDRLKKKGYTKSTAWFSKLALSSGGTYRYFDPNTGMCI